MALVASLLTAIPFTPAGLGLVELGVVGILTLIYGVDQEQAAAIALLDRAISVLSIIVLGSIAYVLSSKTKGNRRPMRDAEPHCVAYRRRAQTRRCRSQSTGIDSRYVRRRPQPAARALVSVGQAGGHRRANFRACGAADLAVLARAARRRMRSAR